MIRIQVKDTYQLSGQYTLENVITEYWDSILLELEQISVLARNMFAQAEYHIEEENILCIEMEVLRGGGREKRSVSSKLLHKIFEERFQMPAEIRMTFKEKEKSK